MHRFLKSLRPHADKGVGILGMFAWLAGREGGYTNYTTTWHRFHVP
jgi:hypothetical protein